jgi:phage head maturation protease
MLCNHIAGDAYDAQECVVTLTEIALCDISLVARPVNPGAEFFCPVERSD